MQVRAIQQGYYGMVRRKPGAVFELVEVLGKRMDPKTRKLVDVVYSPEEQFSDTWMEKVKAGELVEAPAPEVSGKKPFGAKKQKAVGYSASLDPVAHSPSTGDRKVI